MEPQLNQFIGCDKPFDDAKVVIFGAPYDSTTSFRPGTRFGPAAMRAESFGIETYSMLQDRDLVDDTSVFDSGDLELPFGAPDRALDMIEARSLEIVDAGKIPFLLGGEHLVTLGSVRAVAKRYPNLRIVHFDAHADLRDDYLGVKLSHACVIRRCHDILGDGRIFQFGIRSGTRDERPKRQSISRLISMSSIRRSFPAPERRRRAAFPTAGFSTTCVGYAAA